MSTCCPICNRPTATEFRPFCSKRCADVDLGRWFNGNYAVPSVELNEEELDILEKTLSGPLDPDESIS